MKSTNSISLFIFISLFYFSSKLPEIFLSLLLISFHHWYYPISFLEGKILLLSRYDNLEDIHVYTLHFWMCQCLWLCQKLLLPFAAFTVSSELAGSQIGYWFFFFKIKKKKRFVEAEGSRKMLKDFFLFLKYYKHAFVLFLFIFITCLSIQ